MAKTLQSPIILPPETLSKSIITQNAFSLGAAFAVTFQLSSSNIKIVSTETTTESGEIITEYVSQPDTNKELAFSIFLTDEEDARTFGASAGRCGWIDYSTKGEVAEGVYDSDGNKLVIDYEDENGEITSDLDLLLDHVYPENENILVKNQSPGIKSIFSMLFLSNKTFFDKVTDAYGNVYYDQLATDDSGNVTDFLTGETKAISEYQAPVIVQYTIGNTVYNTVYDFIFEDNPIDILNINYLTFRLLFENHGGIITMEIMKPGETFYRPCMRKVMSHNYYGNHNIRFGFGQFTPLFSYDIDKKADFNVHNIQLQQTDERPDWLKIIDSELLIILGDTKFVTEFLAAENKLVVHTDRADDAQLEKVAALLARVLPQNIEVVQYNHHIEISWKDINKYAECTNFSQMTEVAKTYGLSSYKEDLTSEGEWVYPIPKVTNGFEMFMNCPDVKKCSNEIVTHMTTQYRLFSTCGLSGEVDYHFPVSKVTCSELLYRTKIEKANVSLPTATAIGHLVAESFNVTEVSGYFPKATHARYFANGCSKLRVVNAEFPALRSGMRMFTSCQLEKASALRVLNSIPVYDGDYESEYGTIGIGIHIDHQNDEEVLAGIAEAEAKGWTVTVQWNGTATSTASTLSFGQLIYAKVDEMVLPDGTTERYLEWGHYVTDPTGYETFRSLESAYEYFGLEMPEES